MLDGRSVSVVLDVLRPERAALLALLEPLGADEWARSTECPAYTVKGIATHVLGDDLSLLSRQRDRAENGLVQIAADMPGSNFRTLLNTFNDRRVVAAGFLSTELVVDLLRLTGRWTSAYYDAVDPEAPGEPVGFFGNRGSSSPFWHAIAREYIERWVHHCQIRRALGVGSLAQNPFLSVGLEVAAAAAGVQSQVPTEPNGLWSVGSVVLGSAQQAADILTRAHTADEIRALVSGPADAVELLATFAGRPIGWSS